LERPVVNEMMALKTVVIEENHWRKDPENHGIDIKRPLVRVSMKCFKWENICVEFYVRKMQIK